MAEQSWEEAYNKRTSRAWKRLLIFSILLIGAGIFVYNNHDGIFGTVSQGSTAASPDVFSEKGPLHGSGAEKTPAGVMEKRPQGPGEVESIHAKATRAGPAGRNSRGDDSLLLDAVFCTAADRSDLRLKLSVTLFFSGSKEHRRTVTAQRGILAVVAAKAVREMRLEEVRPDVLRIPLVRAMNEVLEESLITAITINTIAIEKVHSE